MAENKRFTKGLQPRHYTAIDALLSRPSVKAAASEAGVNYTTLLKWMAHPKFMPAYRRRGMAAMQHSIELSRNNTNDAMCVIIENINQDTVSLESPVGDEGDDGKSTLGDFLADDKILSPDQESSRRILSDQFKEILNDLSEKERRILEMRHGLNDGVTHTLEEVGQKFGVTRERIRQIEAKAHEKIRNHDKSKRLENY